MNILFAIDIEHDDSSFIDILNKSEHVNNVYVCNHQDELLEILDEYKIDAYIVLVKVPDDFGTIAYDLLITNEIDEERIVILTNVIKGISKSHLVTQIMLNDINQSSFDDYISCFLREEEDE